MFFHFLLVSGCSYQNSLRRQIMGLPPWFLAELMILFLNDRPHIWRYRQHQYSCNIQLDGDRDFWPRRGPCFVWSFLILLCPIKTELYFHHQRPFFFHFEEYRVFHSTESSVSKPYLLSFCWRSSLPIYGKAHPDFGQNRVYCTIAFAATPP